MISSKADGISTIQGKYVNQLMWDVDNTAEDYGTDNALFSRADKSTNFFITGAVVFLSDCDELYPTQTTHSSEEIDDSRGGLLDHQGYMHAANSTPNSTPVRFETPTPSAVIAERLGWTTIHREEVRAELGTPALVERYLKAPRSERAVRRGRKLMRKTV